MNTILITLLLHILHSNPHQFTQKKIEVQLTFDHMQLGKPTLAMYYYDITIQNNEDRTWYVAIPRWFDESIQKQDKVTGAQYDTFGEVKAITLFANSSFTIFQVQPGQKIVIDDFRIETFNEKIREKLSTHFEYAVFNKISIANMTLPDFMAKTDLHDDNLEYLMTESFGEEIEIKIKK